MEQERQGKVVRLCLVKTREVIASDGVRTCSPKIGTFMC